MQHHVQKLAGVQKELEAVAGSQNKVFGQRSR
jgi:hypothetical protein